MRKPFLDNLRYGIVLSVAVYHVFYQFNSVGVITNVLIPGIPALDAPLYVLYPWFMAALFMISGICARCSLEKQTGKQYLKGKVRRQLIPSIAIIFLIGWSTGWVTDQYANIFGGGQVPGFAGCEVIFLDFDQDLLGDPDAHEASGGHGVSVPDSPDRIRNRRPARRDVIRMPVHADVLVKRKHIGRGKRLRRTPDRFADRVEILIR